jgi:hypothetical protein
MATIGCVLSRICVYITKILLVNQNVSVRL